MFSEKYKSTIVKPTGLEFGKALLRETLVGYEEDRAKYIACSERLKQEKDDLSLQIDSAKNNIEIQRTLLNEDVENLKMRSEALSQYLISKDKLIKETEENISRLENGEFSEDERDYFLRNAQELSQLEFQSLSKLESETCQLKVTIEEYSFSKEETVREISSITTSLVELHEGKSIPELEKRINPNLDRLKQEFENKRSSLVKDRQNLTKRLNKQKFIYKKLVNELKESKDLEKRRRQGGAIENFFSRVNPVNWRVRDSSEITADLRAKERLINTHDSNISQTEDRISELQNQFSKDKDTAREKTRSDLISELEVQLSESRHSLNTTETELTTRSEELEILTIKHANYTSEYENALNHRIQDLASKYLEKVKQELSEINSQKDSIKEQIREHKHKIDANALEFNSLQESLDLEICKLKELASPKIHGFQHELNTIETRLEERALRLGKPRDLSIGDWEPSIRPNHVRETIRYRTEPLDTEQLLRSNVVISMPISLRTRINPNGKNYAARKDDILSALVKSGFLDSIPIEEEDQLEIIDSFSQFIFGNDGEKRKFYVACLDTLSNISRLLIRPAEIGPKIIKAFPRGLVPCLACSLEYDHEKGINRLQYWNLSLVPDSAPRPFERKIELERRMGFDGEIPVSNPIDELIKRAGSKLPKIRDEFGARADDWFGYLDWGKRQLYKQAPKLYLGKGELKDSVWVGEGFWKNNSESNQFLREERSKDGKIRPIYEIALTDDTSRNIRVDLTIGDPLPQITLPDEFKAKTAVGIQMEVRLKDRSSGDINDWVAGQKVIYNMSGLRGSTVQIQRQARALERVFGRETKKQHLKKFAQFGDSFGNSPYLAATFFNASQAAVPTRSIKVPDDQWMSPNLNEDQKRAVERMLSATEIAYIQGPPGTGKTSMIAEACSHFIRMGKRVLIASQTNLAVDNALERLQDDPKIRALRINPRDIEGEIFNSLEGWYKSACEHTSSRILEPFSLLEQEISKNRSILSRLTPRLTAYEESLKAIDAISSERQKQNEEVAAIQQEISVQQDTVNESNWWAHILSVLSGAPWDPTVSQNLHGQHVQELFDFAKELEGIDLQAPKSGISIDAQQRHVRRLLKNINIVFSDNSSSNADESYERFRSKVQAKSKSQVANQTLDQTDSYARLRSSTFALDNLSRRLLDAEARRDEVEQQLRPMIESLSGRKDHKASNLAQDCRTMINNLEEELMLLDQRWNDYDALRPWIDLLKDWQHSLEDSDQLLIKNDGVGDHYKSTVNVVGITCNMSPEYFEEANLGRFDVVIIDEVSKATPLELLMPLEKAPCAILVGDHRQLPPTFEFNNIDNSKSDKGPTPDEDDAAIEDEAELLDRYKQLVTSSLFKAGFEHIHPYSRDSLLTQYRMHPDIMALVNRFYDNRLVCGLPTPEPETELPIWAIREHGLTLKSNNGAAYIEPNRHAVWLDSSKDIDGNPVFEKKDSRGVSNDLEAQLAAEVVKKVIDALDPSETKKTISVITFYNMQKRILQDEIAKLLRLSPSKLRKEARVEIETVDRFQGKETDIVIVSMVRNPNHKLSKRSNPAKFERINVAFSRARDLLVIVGAEKVFSRFQVDIEPMDGGSAKSVAVYGQIIEQIREQGGFWRASDVLEKQFDGEKNK